jgi:glycosyltransferase involved in cell wall biosynthesis
MNSFRVVHLTSVHSVFDGRIFDRECRSLATQGYDVTLIGPHPRAETIDNVRIRPVPQAIDRFHRFACTVPAVLRLAVEEDADLYHFHDPELMPVALFLRYRGKQVVYDVHEDYPSTLTTCPWLPQRVRRPASWCFTHVERYAARRFSALVAANPEIMRRIASFNPLAISLGNYPPLGHFPTMPQFDDSRYSSGRLVSFGGISSRTCTAAIVAALGMIPDSVPTTLLLAGSDCSDRLFADISKLPGWRRVTYANKLPVSAMWKRLFDASIAFVLFDPMPNHFGVGSNRLFEAMAAGLPVITSNFPRWKELVDRVGCGITVDPANISAIANAILHLVLHPHEAAEMGRRAHEVAKSEFNWERESPKLHALYEHLLPDKSVDQSIEAALNSG